MPATFRAAVPPAARRPAALRPAPMRALMPAPILMERTPTTRRMPGGPAGGRDGAEMNRRRRPALAALAALALAAAAGCSVPSSGRPVLVGPAPTGTSVNDR